MSEHSIGIEDHCAWGNLLGITIVGPERQKLTATLPFGIAQTA
jgi:hypothetical protein